MAAGCCRDSLKGRLNAWNVALLLVLTINTDDINLFYEVLREQKN